MHYTSYIHRNMYISVSLVFLLKILSVQSRPSGVFDSIGDFFEGVVDSAGEFFEDRIVAEVKDFVADVKDHFSGSDEVTSGETYALEDDPNYNPLHPHSQPSVYPTQRTVGYVPSQTPPYTPVKKPVMQPLPPRPSQIPPKDSMLTPKPQQISPSSDKNCTCTPFFRCYDEETSSNLTAVVDDRNQESCPNPNDICCHNLVEPPQVSPDNSTLNSSPQPQPPSPPQISPPEVNCTCTPFFRCYDEETSSNLTDVVNGRNRESCPNPNDVCCYNLVEPFVTPANNQSSESQPQNPPQMSHKNSTLIKPIITPTINQSSEPQPTSPPQISPKNSTLSPPPQPQSPSPNQMSPPNVNCTCTPFFRCYDEERSSNLTTVEDDRTQESCPNSNDVCCYNSVQPPTLNLSPQPQSNGTTLTSTQNLKMNQTSQPQPYDPSQTAKDNSTMTQILQAQPPSPSLISPVSNVSCTCIPFLLCNDEETEAVEDGSRFTEGQENCPDQNEICCHDLIQQPLPQTRNPPLPLESQGPSQIDVHPTKG